MERRMQMGKLNLDEVLVSRGREAARKIADETQEFINVHSTVAVERTICRLYGIDGVDDAGVPLPNIVVDSIKLGGDINLGCAYYLANAVLCTGLIPQEIAENIALGEVDI